MRSFDVVLRMTALKKRLRILFRFRKEDEESLNLIAMTKEDTAMTEYYKLGNYYG